MWRENRAFSGEWFFNYQIKLCQLVLPIKSWKKTQTLFSRSLTFMKSRLVLSIDFTPLNWVKLTLSYVQFIHRGLFIVVIFSLTLTRIWLDNNPGLQEETFYFWVKSNSDYSGDRLKLLRKKRTFKINTKIKTTSFLLKYLKTKSMSLAKIKPQAV